MSRIRNTDSEKESEKGKRGVIVAVSAGLGRERAGPKKDDSRKEWPLTLILSSARTAKKTCFFLF
jgi:hypothetical protein